MEQKISGEDGWRQSEYKNADYVVFDVLHIDGLCRAMVECFTTHRTFYANAIDKDDHPHRTVWNEFEPAKAWCDEITGFARKN